MTKTDPSLERFELFARTRERIGSGLIVAMRLQLPQVADDLDEMARRSRSERDAEELRGLAQRLRGEGMRRVASLPGWLNERTLRSLELADQIDLAEDGRQAWRLLAGSELELQILAADLTRQIRVEAKDFYSEYAARIAVLTQRQWPFDEMMPLSASILAVGVFTLLDGLTDPQSSARTDLRRAVQIRIPGPLAEVLRDAEAHLVLHGVRGVVPVATVTPLELDLPTPQGTPVTAAAPSAAAASPAEPPPAEPAVSASTAAQTASASAQAASAQAAASAVTAADAPLAADFQALEEDVAHARRLGSSVLASPDARQPRFRPRLRSVEEIEEDAVAFARGHGVAPFSRASRHAFFNRLRRRLEKAGASPGQLAEVDIVGAMFDYVVDDKRASDASRTLLWRLHRPVTALSLLDPGYLVDDPRSLRRLVEDIGAIASARSQSLTRDDEVFRRIETVVRAVEIVASGLQTRSAVLADQADREFTRASRSVAKLVQRLHDERNEVERVPTRIERRNADRRPDAEAERKATQYVRDLIAKRTSNRSAPSSVNAFLQQVWSRHLRTALLRDGQESARFQQGVGAVDDLLWTLGQGERQPTRGELAVRIPQLVQVLNAGVREVDAKDGEYKPFFDELFVMHLNRIHHPSAATRAGTAGSAPRAAEAARAPAAAQPPQGPEGAQSPQGPQAPQGPHGGAAGHDVPAPVPVLDQRLELPRSERSGEGEGAQSAGGGDGAQRGSADRDGGARRPSDADAGHATDELKNRAQPDSRPGSPSAQDRGSDPGHSAHAADDVADDEDQDDWEAGDETGLVRRGLIKYGRRGRMANQSAADQVAADAEPPAQRPVARDQVDADDGATTGIEVDELWGGDEDDEADVRGDDRHDRPRVGARDEGRQQSSRHHPAADAPRTGHDLGAEQNEAGEPLEPPESRPAQSHQSPAGRSQDATETGSTEPEVRAGVRGSQPPPQGHPRRRHGDVRFDRSSLSGLDSRTGEATDFGFSVTDPRQADAGLKRPSRFNRKSGDSRFGPVTRPGAGEHEVGRNTGRSSARDAAARAMPSRLPELPTQAGAGPETDRAPVLDQRLIDILNAVDLGDRPRSPRRVTVSGQAAIEAVRRGHWLELESSDGRFHDAKIAWINPRRSVVLVVRRQDRKAMSLRMNDLRIRFERGRAFLID